MILLKKDIKQGIISLKTTLPDDLWYLTHIIYPGDKMKMKTERKLKLGSSETNVSVVRKKMVLTLAVESVDLSDTSELRIKGTVLEGPEEVPKGSYHTFGVRVHDSFTLYKDTWPAYLLDKLQEATKNTSQTIIIVQYDREQALFSLVRQQGIEHLGEISAVVEKKDYHQSPDKSLYEQIIASVETLLTTKKASGIVFASADFWKKYVQEKLPKQLKDISVFVSTPEVAKASVAKLLARPELHKLLGQQRVRKEQSLVAMILQKLDAGIVAYGITDVTKAAEAGAISHLAITEHFMLQQKEENSFDTIIRLLTVVDQSKGKVTFLHEDDTAKIIDGLGGIAGVLRWKMS